MSIEAASVFQMTQDLNKRTAYGLKFSSLNYNVNLAAGVAQSFVVPSKFNFWHALFAATPGSTIWVSVDGAATLPGAAFALSTSEANPALRQVKAGETLSIISAQAISVGVRLDGLPHGRV